MSSFEMHSLVAALSVWGKTWEKMGGINVYHFLIKFIITRLICICVTVRWKPSIKKYGRGGQEVTNAHVALHPLLTTLYGERRQKIIWREAKEDFYSLPDPMEWIIQCCVVVRLGSGLPVLKSPLCLGTCWMTFGPLVKPQNRQRQGQNREKGNEARSRAPK